MCTAPDYSLQKRPPFAAIYLLTNYSDLLRFISMDFQVLYMGSLPELWRQMKAVVAARCKIRRHCIQFALNNVILEI